MKAVFVGVNKYRDANIPDLNGARRDATALWSLFADTIPSLSSRLLVDEDATLAAVTGGIIGSLQSAGEDDVVIISFAGHGTADGNLVLHDTDTTQLGPTTLSMGVLAGSFKSTRARAVLCILDCCFSGQAPARVLESAGRPRNVPSLAAVAGEGRILISACAAHESAWEQPGTGHGILTYAVIEALTSALGDHVHFPDVAGEIVRLARLEAGKMAITQTPVFLGTIEGGLTFPILKRGENFLAAFPTIAPIHIADGRFTELVRCGIPPEIVDSLTARFPGGLNALQMRAVSEHGVLDGRSLLVIAPTSSGKTMIGELAAIRAVSEGKKAAFLLPYRALVNEKFDEFTDRYSPIGLRVVRCSGDASDGVGPALQGKYDLAFFTYEMFLNLALVSPRLLNQLGLIAIDEGQFITDPSRGITVELIYALLLRARSLAINPQIIVLSAVIGALNGFDRWLGIPVLKSEERPVPLIEGVLDRRGTFQFVDTDGSSKSEQLLAPHAIVQRKDKPSAQDVIVPLAQQLITAGEKILIFRNMRGPAQGCAKYLAKALRLSPASTALDALPTQDLTGASQELRECLLGGTAFHSTNLLRAEKEVVEKEFRNPSGQVYALAATTTLAAGINTPASTVILAENEFVGEDGRPFTVAEYKNMAGRAGRLGFNEIGKAVILAETPLERAQLFQKYVQGKPEPVTSSFRQEDLPTWTLRLLSQVKGISSTDIPMLLVNTFAGYSASLVNPAWAEATRRNVAAFVSRLLKAGLAEQEGDVIHLTMLGRACGASSLSFDSALRLVELMRRLNADQTPAVHIIAILQVLAEMDSIYTPVMKRGRTESVRVSDASQRYGSQVVQLLQQYCHDEIQFWGRCKRAALLWDWMEGVAVDELEKRYTSNPFQGVIGYGDITRIADGARFHLRSAHRILTSLFPDNPTLLKEIEVILQRLEFGLPSAVVSLSVNIPGLMRGQYLALFSLGCRTLDDAKSLTVEQLTSSVGPAFAARIYPPKALAAT